MQGVDRFEAPECATSMSHTLPPVAEAYPAACSTATQASPSLPSAPSTAARAATTREATKMRGNNSVRALRRLGENLRHENLWDQRQ
jgi:hypothetical protein